MVIYRQSDSYDNCYYELDYYTSNYYSVSKYYQVFNEIISIVIIGYNVLLVYYGIYGYYEYNGYNCYNWRSVKQGICKGMIL